MSRDRNDTRVLETHGARRSIEDELSIILSEKKPNKNQRMKGSA